MSDDYLAEGLQAARDVSANKSTTASGQAYAVVNNPRSTQALNLRQYASTASRVLDKLYNGRRLWINEQGTEWCAVTMHNTSASTRMVTHPNGSYVNLRSSRDMSQNNVIIRVPHGQWVTVITPGTDWCKVQFGGFTGYMLSYFLP